MITRLSLAGVVFCGTLWSSDWCALQVKAISSRGESVSATGVLVDDRGAIVASAEAKHGVIEFCDFDFGEHLIIVTAPGYMKTIIAGVRVIYNHAQMLTAVLNSHDSGDGGMNGCLFYFRIKGPEGKPLSFPEIKRCGTNNIKIGDKYGRITDAVLLGNQRSLCIGAEGHEETRIAVNCDSAGEYEKTIVLHQRK
jgi:hypothetical protein